MNNLYAWLSNELGTEKKQSANKRLTLQVHYKLQNKSVICYMITIEMLDGKTHPNITVKQFSQ